MCCPPLVWRWSPAVSCPKQCYTRVVSIQERRWQRRVTLSADHQVGHRNHHWLAHRQTTNLPRSWAQMKALSSAVCFPRDLRLWISRYLDSPVQSFLDRRWRLPPSPQRTVLISGWHKEDCQSAQDLGVGNISQRGCLFPQRS